MAWPLSTPGKDPVPIVQEAEAQHILVIHMSYMRLYLYKLNKDSLKQQGLNDHRLKYGRMRYT
jgi:hypothetical protein